MRGRKPTPTHLKIVQGNPGKRALDGAEPAPEAARLPPPDWLPEAARAEWLNLQDELYRWGLLTRLDHAAFEAYCVAYATFLEAHEKLSGTGLIVKSPKGYPIQNPYLAIRNRAMEEMRAFAALFGFSPADRVRLKGVRQGDLFDNEFTRGLKKA